MNDPKPNRRKPSARKLEPIDWHEYANDAVLKGNMSTLFQRPPNEDLSAYASSEALVEIQKRSPVIDPEGSLPPVEIVPSDPPPTIVSRTEFTPTVELIPPEGPEQRSRKIKPIRTAEDALTLAGKILYRNMYGPADDISAKTCSKGYRQLAAETHLDKDTVRDLIADFKEKGILREIGAYNPDTRSSKTYEVLSSESIVQAWRAAGIQFVTSGRQRPELCNQQGQPVTQQPRVVSQPTVGSVTRSSLNTHSVDSTSLGAASIGDILQALRQITGAPVDRETAARLVDDCRAAAPGCTVEEIIEIAWSKAYLCRSGRIESPLAFLLSQVPQHFEPEALQEYRANKSRELEAASVIAAREDRREREYRRELAAIEERHRLRTQIAEKHRTGQGIDLRGLLEDPTADEVLKDWARRMIKSGRRYPSNYD